MVDNIDKKIMQLLQDNSRISNAEIARKLDMATSSVFERIKQLENKGIIKEYTAWLDCSKLGCDQIVFLLLRTTEMIGEIGAAKKIAEIPEVQEVHHVAGEDCYIVKLRVKDNKELASIMRNKLGKIKSISSSKTIIVLESIKETGKLNIN